MAIINIVVPQLAEHTFSGGIYCIMRHAVGLRALGHDVNIIPLLPSPRPQWIKGDFGWMPDGSKRVNRKRILSAAAALLKLPGSRRSPGTRTRELKQRLLSAIGYASPRMFAPLVQRALQLGYVAECIPQADVTLATSFETALAVRLHGMGRKFYFAQHYEPYFAADLTDPDLSELEARGSYHFGLQMIANSSWLKSKLERDEQLQNVLMCPNAIDLEIFCGAPKPERALDEIRIISYGGRNATWKGFADMAHGMRLARERCPELRLQWLVYGSALLPPDNDVAPYESLGFLQLPALAEAYRSADLLLSASWYESFPLFPIEAMACGLPVITSQPGTEEYAIHGETAEVVRPREAESIASAIVKLARDAVYRHRLAVNGHRKAQEFSWAAASQHMQRTLFASNNT